MVGSRSTRSDSSRGLAFVLAVGTLFTLAILTEVRHFNGPEYWEWPWRTLSFDRAAIHFAAPLVFFVYLFRTWGNSAELTAKRAGWLVTGLVACSMLLQYASLHADRRGRRVIPDIVHNTGITSYFTDAQNIQDVSTWLPDFANLELEHHSETHPPGPILFWYACIQLFGERDAPLIGALLIGMFASLGVALIYQLGWLWTPDRSARIGPCFLYALLPSILVFIPELDQVYPLGSMAMLLFWHRAFERRRAAVWLGLTLFAVSLMAYNFVTLGVMMVLYALLRLRRERWNKAAIQRVALASGIALAVALGAHVLLWAATSYHAIDSLLASLATQEVFAANLDRPYWQCVFWDIYDFLLGSGMLTFPLIAIGLRRHLAELGEVPIDRAVTVIAIASILIIDFTGLLRCEAARVWLFLQPLIIVPAGLQFARYNLADRGLILTMQVVIAIVLRCKLTFIDI